MKHYSFYHKGTGVVHPNLFATDDPSQVASNVPPGHAVIEGKHHPLYTRVDIATGQVIDHKPDPPSSDHAWNADMKRWELTEAALAARQADANARWQISQMESRQARAVREAMLGIPGGVERLQKIEATIAALRVSLIEEKP